MACASCGLSVFLRMWLFSKGDVGYELNSYLITSYTRRFNYPVLETTRNRWKSKLGSMLLPRAIVTRDELLRVSALSILLKTLENTCLMKIQSALHTFPLTRTYAH